MRRYAPLILVAVLLTACGSHAASTVPRGIAGTAPTPGATPVRCVALLTTPGRPLPDPHCTPGVTHGTSKADVCPHVNPALEAGRPTQAVKDRVYAAYGITTRTPGQYEVDHLIPLELDGANDPANLWPQTNDHPAARVLNSKDLLENRLHSLVCAGSLPLADAQHAIATDWPGAYARYMTH